MLASRHLLPPEPRMVFLMACAARANIGATWGWGGGGEVGLWAGGDDLKSQRPVRSVAMKHGHGSPAQAAPLLSVGPSGGSVRPEERGGRACEHHTCCSRRRSTLELLQREAHSNSTTRGAERPWAVPLP